MCNDFLFSHLVDIILLIKVNYKKEVISNDFFYFYTVFF